MLSLSLATPTSPIWVEQALLNIDLLLLDHANCEKKAAGNALSLLFRYPTHTVLVNALSPLAREELQHFEKVNRHLERLGIAPKKLAAAPYASQLGSHLRRQDPDYLLDSLLSAAIIEARSHERLALLGAHCPDPELSDFYQWLAQAEERHYALYLDLALEYVPLPQAQLRLAQLLTIEAQIVQTTYQQLPYPPLRIHS